MGGGAAVRALTGAMAAVALAGGALAQGSPAPEQPAPEQPVTEEAVEEQVEAPASPLEQALAGEPESGRTIEELLADAIARRALLRLRGVASPTPDQYRLAATALEAALRYAPDDLHLLRRLADAQRAAGDEAAELATLRRVVGVDPADTVTQLRLLNHAIRSRQTVQERVEAYDRLLGSAGAGLDASLRSRLALDAALLAREAGDERGFVSRLTLATQLDPTNKGAAVLASRFALSRLEDPLARVETLTNVVLADPLDAQAHQDLARELLAHGAHLGAGRFLDRAAELLARAGRATPPDMRMDRVVVEWRRVGPEAMFARFDDAIAVERYSVEQALRAVESGDLPADEAPPPYLPQRWREESRLAMALAIDDAEQAARALEGLAEIDEADRKALDESDLAPEERERRRAGIEASALLRTLWANGALEGAAGRLEAIEGLIESTTASVIRGWIAAREGRFEDAEAQFDAVGADDARGAAGLAMRYELDDRPVDAARRHALLVRRAPGSLLGMWARGRIERLLDAPVRETAVERELNAYAMALPAALDRMTRDPGSFIDLSVEHAEARIGVLGRVEVRVRLRNGGVIPLAVGDDAPLNSRVLLSPELTVGGTKVLQGLTPEVVSLATRLRLTPGGSLEVVYWAGQGATGQFMAFFPSARATLRWRGLQGFGVYADGSYGAGAMSRTAMSDMLQRRAPPEALLGLDALVARIGASAGEARLRAIAMALWLLTNGGNLPTEDERFALRTAVARAVTDAWPTLAPAERAWILFSTPDSLSVPEAAPIEEAAFADAAPETRLALLMTRAAVFPDRVLPLGDSSDDALAARYAAVVARLRREQSVAPLPIR